MICNKKKTYLLKKKKHSTFNCDSHLSCGAVRSIDLWTCFMLLQPHHAAHFQPANFHELPLHRGHRCLWKHDAMLEARAKIKQVLYQRCAVLQILVSIWYQVNTGLAFLILMQLMQRELRAITPFSLSYILKCFFKTWNLNVPGYMLNLEDRNKALILIHEYRSNTNTSVSINILIHSPSAFLFSKKTNK